MNPPLVFRFKEYSPPRYHIFMNSFSEAPRNWEFDLEKAGLDQYSIIFLAKICSSYSYAKGTSYVGLWGSETTLINQPGSHFMGLSKSVIILGVHGILSV